MDSPGLPPGSPMFDDDDEGTYPCKGCGKVCRNTDSVFFVFFIPVFLILLT